MKYVVVRVGRSHDDKGDLSRSTGNVVDIHRDE